MTHAAHDAPTWTVAVLTAVVLAGGYGAAAWALRSAGRPWRAARTVVFTAGVTVLAVGISPVVAELGSASARSHMAQHVLLGMAAPLGLVLGAPLTLGLAVLPVRARRRATAILRSRAVRAVTHPLTAGTLHVGGLYVLYLTPLYARTVTDPWAHALVLVHVVAAGCLFVWSMAGPEQVSRRRGTAWRVGVLVGASAAHGYLAKLLYLRAPALPPASGHDVAALQDAARWMYSAGDVAEVALAVALFAAWYRRAGRRVAAARGAVGPGGLAPGDGRHRGGP